MAFSLARDLAWARWHRGTGSDKWYKRALRPRPSTRSLERSPGSCWRGRRGRRRQTVCRGLPKGCQRAAKALPAPLALGRRAARTNQQRRTPSYSRGYTEHPRPNHRPAARLRHLSRSSTSSRHVKQALRPLLRPCNFPSDIPVSLDSVTDPSTSAAKQVASPAVCLTPLSSTAPNSPPHTPP